MRTKKPCTNMIALAGSWAPLGSGPLHAGASEARAPASTVAERKAIREPHDGRFTDPLRDETPEVYHEHTR